MNPRRLHLTSVGGLLIFASACVTPSNEATTPGVGGNTIVPTETSGSDPSTAETEATRAPIPIAPSLHPSAMTEVVLDPQGSAALTLDEDGGVRLWPLVMGEDVEAPLELPVRQPVWMSLARTPDDSSFIAAFIDTAGGAQIGRIEASDAGSSWTPMFDHSPARPLFELHVLDGGDRIVALSVDHQIELWTPRGKVLAEIDQPGFVPWQLRVSQSGVGDPEILAVLGRPVRVQKVGLHDDALSIEGEARPVNMDRGPNRNDLVMSPDGRFVTVLRRPTARDKRFEVEVTELSSGARRLVAAESDLRTRPRVYPIDSQRLLIDSGSGYGFFLDLSLAVPWPPQGVDPNAEPPTSQLASKRLTEFPLPGSTEDTRFHSDFAGGVRVVPDGDALVVAPIDDRPVVTHRAAPFDATALALDETGDTVAWGVPGEVLIENRRGAPLQRISTSGSTPALLAFVDSHRWVAMDEKGRVILRDLQDGDVVDRGQIEFSWGIDASGWRRSDGGGSVILSSIKPGEPVHVLSIGADGFGDELDVPRADQASWPEAGKPRGRQSREWVEQLGLSWDDLRLRPASVRLSEPDPSGSKIAIVQKTQDVAGFDAELDRWTDGPDEFVVTMVDRESAKRLWTRRARGFRDAAWSADGAVFGFVDADGGYLCDADDGDLLHTRRDLGLLSTTGEH